MYRDVVIVDGTTSSVSRASPATTVAVAASSQGSTPIMDSAEKATSWFWRGMRVVGIVLLIALAGYVVWQVAKPIVSIVKSIGKTANAAATASEGIATAAETIGNKIAEGAVTFADNPLKWIVQKVVDGITKIVETIQWATTPAVEAPLAPTAFDAGSLITGTAETTFIETIPEIIEAAEEALPAIMPIPF